MLKSNVRVRSGKSSRNPPRKEGLTPTRLGKSGKSRVKAVIFDFDGVILESVEAKVEAFRKLFQDQPKHLKAILHFHIENGGMGRYEKFKVIYRDMLKKELTPHRSKWLGKKFTEYSLSQVLKARFVKGAHGALRSLSRKYKLFIVSGTPQPEMRFVVKKRSLSRYFSGVYGTPRKKGELAHFILAKYRLQPSEAVFIGDSKNDLQGAREAKVRFIGRIHPGSPDPFLRKPGVYKRIKDLSELTKIITAMS